MRRIRFRARSLKTGEWVEGYYAHQHLANFDADGQHIIDYTEQDAIYNDEPGNRNGSYWVNIDPETLSQQTSMDDMFYMPIWEHDKVRLYSLRAEGHQQSDPHHEEICEVVFLSTAFAIQFEDGTNMTMAAARRHYAMQVIESPDAPPVNVKPQIKFKNGKPLNL